MSVGKHTGDMGVGVTGSRSWRRWGGREGRREGGKEGGKEGRREGGRTMAEPRGGR